MRHGKIISFNERNSGFIRQSGVKDDLFFDESDLQGVSFRELHVGDVLAFMVTESLKGPYATRVTRTA